MSKNVTQKEFTDYIDKELGWEEYDRLVDWDNCLDLLELFKVITRKFNLTPKE